MLSCQLGCFPSLWLRVRCCVLVVAAAAAAPAIPALPAGCPNARGLGLCREGGSTTQPPRTPTGSVHSFSGRALRPGRFTGRESRPVRPWGTSALWSLQEILRLGVLLNSLPPSQRKRPVSPTISLHGWSLCEHGIMSQWQGHPGPCRSCTGAQQRC